MPIKLPSIPEPGNDPASQLNTLRALKQVVDLIAANATGDKNSSGPGVGAQIFALQDDVKQLMRNQTAALTNSISQNQTNTEWTVDQAVSSLNQDISDARNKAIQARADALQALDDFENSTFLETIYRIDQDLADANAAISSEAGARATADDAQSGRITKAAAFMGLNEATWREGDLSVATRFNAMSTGYKEYIARTGDDFLSTYTSHVVTTTDFTNAVSTRLNTLETKITVPSTPGRLPLLLSSAIIDESNTTTDATKKIATAQNIQTTVASLSNVAGQNGATTDGAITAAVKVESQARTTAINNIKSTAAYSVVVSTTGPAGPAVSGFRTVSDSSSTTPISDFQIFADKFRITNGSATKTPFSIDAINSKINMSADVAINGNLIVSGSVKASNIGPNEISDNRAEVVLGAPSAAVIGMNLAVGDRVTIIGFGGGSAESGSGGSGSLQIYYASPNVPGGGAWGPPVTVKAFCRFVNDVKYYFPQLSSNVTVGIGANYALPPASIIQVFPATAAGLHNFSVYNTTGGDTGIAVIRLSR